MVYQWSCIERTSKALFHKEISFICILLVHFRMDSATFDWIGGDY